MTIKINKDARTATVECSVCKNDWNTDKITPLYHAVDVYADWIDACERENPDGADD